MVDAQRIEVAEVIDEPVAAGAIAEMDRFGGSSRVVCEFGADGHRVGFLACGLAPVGERGVAGLFREMGE